MTSRIQDYCLRLFFVLAFVSCGVDSSDGEPSLHIADLADLASSSEMRFDMGLPDLIESTSDVFLPLTFMHIGLAYPSECIDGAVTYNPPNYWVRMRVTGRPGAVIRKFNYHESCGNFGAIEWEDCDSRLKIPPSGVLEHEYYNVALPCDIGALGRWRSYVIVDGQKSNYSYVTYFQSSCTGGPLPSFATCFEAKSFCPRSGAFNWPYTCPPFIQ